MSIRMSVSIPLVSKLYTGDMVGGGRGGGVAQRDVIHAVGWCCSWETVSLGIHCFSSKH